MPIDVESDAWQNAVTEDPIEAKVAGLLSKNQDKAYSIAELDDYLCEECPHVFPADLTENEDVDAAEVARQAMIANILEDLYWHEEVTFRTVTGDDAEPGLYYTWRGVGINPIAELDEVSDPNPDSPFGTLSSRFRQIDDDVDELERRLNQIERRVQDELGRY
jgi:hypothetical protein